MRKPCAYAHNYTNVGIEGGGCPKSNNYYTKWGGFDKLNHRNANLLDSPLPTFLTKSGHRLTEL